MANIGDQNVSFTLSTKETALRQAGTLTIEKVEDSDVSSYSLIPPHVVYIDLAHAALTYEKSVTAFIGGTTDSIKIAFEFGPISPLNITVEHTSQVIVHPSQFLIVPTGGLFKNFYIELNSSTAKPGEKYQIKFTSNSTKFEFSEPIEIVAVAHDSAKVSSDKLNFTAKLQEKNGLLTISVASNTYLGTFFFQIFNKEKGKET